MKPEDFAELYEIHSGLEDLRCRLDVLLIKLTPVTKKTEVNFHADPKIANLKDGDTNVQLTATCHELGSVGSFTKKSDGSKGSVRRVTFTDGTGYIAVPLWNDQIEKIVPVVGREYDISAWKVEEYPRGSGKLQLVLGKEGHILPAGQEAL